MDADDLAPCPALETFMRAAGGAVEDAMDRLGPHDRRRLERAMDAGLIIGYSIRLDVDLRSQQAAIVFEVVQNNGHRETVRTSLPTYPTAH